MQVVPAIAEDAGLPEESKCNGSTIEPAPYSKVPCPYEHAGPYHDFCFLCGGTGQVERRPDYRIQSHPPIDSMHVGNRFRLLAGLSLLPEES